MIESLSAFDALQARRRADAVHAEAGRRRAARGVREGRRHARAHVPLRHRQRDEPRLPRRLAGRRAARSWPASGRRRSTRSTRTRRSGSWRRPATPSASPASTPCASTASACTPRARRSSPPTRPTSTRACRRSRVNRYGAGRVYYLAARPAGDAFHDALARGLVARAGARALPRRRAARGRHRPEARGRRADVPLPAQLHARRSRRSTSARPGWWTSTDGSTLTGKVTLPAVRLAGGREGRAPDTPTREPLEADLRRPRRRGRGRPLLRREGRASWRSAGAPSSSRSRSRSCPTSRAR